jgi:phage baseplate assembly protein V
MSTGLEPGSGWAGERGLSPGMLAQLQRFIQPLRNRVMGMVARGWVRLTYRGEPMQLLQVGVLKDELSDLTEHFQPYGFTSVPLVGMDALIHFLSGDRSAGIVSVVADRTSRPLTMREGEVAIYHSSDTPTATAEQARHRITLTLGKLIIRVDELDIKCGESSLKMNDAGWVARGRDFEFQKVG